MRMVNLQIVVLLMLLLAMVVGIVVYADIADSLYAYPNPYHPARQNACHIHYELKMDAVVFIDVYDSRGKHVRNVIYHQIKRPGEHVGDVWDGRNDDGEYVPAGIYIVRIKIEYSGRTVENATTLVGLAR